MAVMAEPLPSCRGVTQYLLDPWPDNLYIWMATDSAQAVARLRDVLGLRLRVSIDTPTPRVYSRVPERVPPAFRWYLRIRRPGRSLAAEAERCLRELFAPPPAPPPAPAPPRQPDRLGRAGPPSDRRCSQCNDSIPAARVEALPDCRLCVPCQERLEQSGGGPRAPVTDPGEEWFRRSECWRSKAGGGGGRR